MSRALLQVESISVGYPVEGGSQVVVDALSLSLQPGEIGCLLGASGCGKTTVLRAVAGFEPLRSGRIVVDGSIVASGELQMPPERRRVGMMFQDYALFPHLSIAANVAFGLNHSAPAERSARTAEMLALVGLAARGRAYPHELSGGQQQRVALARALAPRPALLLLDEPFSNLDLHTREHLAGELRGLLKASGTTALLVTHDQAEAFAMADSIGVMDRGHILQWGNAPALYRQPADRHVAAFVGRGAVVDGAALGLEPGVDVLLRPEHWCHDPAGPVSTRLRERVFRGPGFVCTVALASGQLVEAELPAGLEPAPGDQINFRLLTSDLRRFVR